MPVEKVEAAMIFLQRGQRAMKRGGGPGELPRHRHERVTILLNQIGAASAQASALCEREGWGSAACSRATRRVERIISHIAKVCSR